MVITALHIAADLERMGDLAEHVAKTALRRHPSPAVPAELRPVFRQMADVADRMADKITIVLAKPDADLRRRARERRRRDGRAARASSSRCCSADDWPYGVETAIDGALLGRFYERYADHAVNAGRARSIYLVTGEPAITLAADPTPVTHGASRPLRLPIGVSGPGWRPRRRPPWRPPGRGTRRRR